MIIIIFIHQYHHRITITTTGGGGTRVRGTAMAGRRSSRQLYTGMLMPSGPSLHTQGEDNDEEEEVMIIIFIHQHHHHHHHHHHGWGRDPGLRDGYGWTPPHHGSSIRTRACREGHTRTPKVMMRVIG
jgi:hypothetical protein